MLARFLVLALVPALLLGLIPSGAAAQSAPDFAIANGRFFTQTSGSAGKGYAVTDDGGVRFWSEFRRLGGVQAVGYPASQRFQWDGFSVQVFQRVVFQWRPESGRVAFVNVFDRLSELGKDDWLAQTKMTPAPGKFDDGGKPFDQVIRERLALAQANDTLGQAYGRAAGDLAPIDANGLPQRAIVDVGPAYVLRNQRTVLQLWKQDVPWARAGEVTVALGGDIAKEAGILPDPTALQPVDAPSAPAAPATRGTVVLDPGHGGFESGAARNSPRLIEKDFALDVARRLRDRLTASGVQVVMTREGDTQVNQAGRDLNSDGKVDVDDDLQARVDVSNEAKADVFLSLHANGGDPGMRGLSTFYCASCPTAAAGRRLATALHREVLAALAPLGATQFGAGVLDEAGLGKPFGHLFVIGPKTPRVARPLEAPAAALIELLFVSNAQDAALIVQPEVRDRVAAALASGVEGSLAR
jgi:N-acetylmuramoyl-L-alanine amidase